MEHDFGWQISPFIRDDFLYHCQRSVISPNEYSLAGVHHCYIGEVVKITTPVAPLSQTSPDDVPRRDLAPPFLGFGRIYLEGSG